MTQDWSRQVIEAITPLVKQMWQAFPSLVREVETLGNRWAALERAVHMQQNDIVALKMQLDALQKKGTVTPAIVDKRSRAQIRKAAKKKARRQE